MGKRSPGDGVYDGNDVGGVDDWGEVEGNGSPLDEDVDGGEHEHEDGGVELQ